MVRGYGRTRATGRGRGRREAQCLAWVTEEKEVKWSVTSLVGAMLMTQCASLRS